MKVLLFAGLVLALIVAGVGLFNQQAQTIQVQAESNQLMVRVLESLSRVIEQQAAANVELMQAQANEARAQALLYTALSIVLFILAAVAVGLFVLVVNAHRKEKQQAPRIVYLMAPEQQGMLPPGQSAIVIPQQTKVRDYVQR